MFHMTQPTSRSTLKAIYTAVVFHHDLDNLLYVIMNE